MSEWLKKLPASLERLSLTVWVGGMMAVMMAVVVLFSQIPDRALAGQVASRLFNHIFVAGLICGTVLLLLMIIYLRSDFWKQWRLWMVAVMVSLFAVCYFGIKPQMDQLRQARAQQPANMEIKARFDQSHRLSSKLFALTCLLGLTLVVAGRPKFFPHG